MKKLRLSLTQKILLSIALLFLSLVIVPQIIWMMLPAHSLSIVVIDKTTGGNYREHQSLFWLLRHWKYVKPSNGNYYDETKDYYGFFPGDSSYSGSESLHLTDQNLLYITDTYGVYRYPVDFDSYERLISKSYIPSTLVYGGLTVEEIGKIEKFDASGGMIVAEFNTLESPTSDHPDVKRRLEKILGIHFNGALGRYYSHLQDVPLWMKEAYKVQTHEAWDFMNEGIIITDGRAGLKKTPKVIVLDRNDLKYIPVLITKKDHPFMRNVSTTVPYYYFFEYLDLDSSAVTLAEFSLQCNKRGMSKMKDANLPVVFPAVISADSSLRKIYFAGDFADNEVQTMFTCFAGIEYPLGKVFGLYLVSDQTRFFWRLYVPLMDNIFKRSLQRSDQPTNHLNSQR
jgi:hypothetical protein